MKKFLKSLALILALTMILQMLIISIAAASGKCGKNATYSLDTETGLLTLGGSGATDDYNIFDEGWLPSIGGSFSPKHVPWKQNADSVKTVVVGEGITQIGKNAFSQCDNVKEIKFLSKSTQISSSAFETSKSYTIYLYRNSTADKYFSGANHTKIYLESETYELCGDINSDGYIGMDDIVLFAQHLAAWGGTINESNADCNGDGDINIEDIVLLAQYVAGWGVTLG